MERAIETNRKKHPDRVRRETARGLLRVVEAISSTLEPKDVLYRLVDETVRMLDCERAVILTLGEEGLIPAAASAKEEDVQLFRRFKEMEPIPLDEASRREVVVRRREVVVVHDARESPLIPTSWVEEFGTRSLAAVPLAAHDEPLGVLVVDHTSPHEFTEEEREVLRGIADAARTALGNALLHQQVERVAEVQSKLLDGMTAVGSAVHLDAVLASIAEAVSPLFGDARCTITLLDEDAPTAVGGSVAGDHRTSFPLRTEEDLLGHLALETPEDLGPEEHRLVEGFAHQAAYAIERSRLTGSLEGELQRTEALHRLSEVLGGVPVLESALDELNRTVCRGFGFECLEVAFRSRRLADPVGCRVLEEDERPLLRRPVDRGPDLVPVEDGETLATRVLVAGRPGGLLFLRPLGVGEEGLDPATRAFIDRMASSIGDVAYKARLRSILQQAELRTQLAATRRHLAEHLDRTAGSTLQDLWDRLAGLADHHSDPALVQEVTELRELVAQGMVEVQTAAESLTALRVQSDGLHSALRGLLRRFGELASISTSFRVQGVPRPLPLTAEERLYRIVFEALSTVHRASRASATIVVLRYEGGSVRLSIRDDGVELAQRTDGGPRPGVHYGMAAIRKQVEELGGNLSAEPAEPRGVRIEVVVPRAGSEGPPMSVRQSPEREPSSR